MSNSTYPFIVRFSSELALKSKPVQQSLYKVLLNNLSYSLKKSDIEFKIKKVVNQFILTTDDKPTTLAILKRTFGVGSYNSIELVTSTEVKEIETSALNFFKELVNNKTFAVRVKKMGSAKLSATSLERNIGALLNKTAKGVNLSKPEVTCHLEIHNNICYYFSNKITGAGGLPANSSGRALCLMSGGYDSPVAAWQIMKRGVAVDYIFFNLAGQAYEKLVLQVTKVLSDLWSGHDGRKIYVVNFTETIEYLKEHVSPSTRQIILKKLMLKISSQFANKHKYDCLISGDAIGQVSSQTLKNLTAITQSCETMLLRPLIGTDKIDIIHQARIVGTASLSDKIREFCSISNGKPMISGDQNRLNAIMRHIDPKIIEQATDSIKCIAISTITGDFLRSEYLYTESFDQKSTVIDCQDKSYFNTWHVPGSKNISFDELSKSYHSLDKEKTYVLYCTYGTKTPLIVELMQQNGYNAYAFKGGLSKVKAWSQSHPLSH